MGDVLIAQVGVDRLEVRFARHLGVDEDRPRLGGKPNRRLGSPEEQRLLSEPIARRQQRAWSPVPNRQREYPAQMVDTACYVIFVEVDDRLGVGLRLEPVSPRAEIISELHVVVDLPVEDDHDRAVLVVDRLIAVDEVDHRQALYSEADALGRMDAAGVGTSVLERLAHLLDQGSVHCANEVNLPGDPAHVARSLAGPLVQQVASVGPAAVDESREPNVSSTRARAARVPRTSGRTTTTAST